MLHILVTFGVASYMEQKLEVFGSLPNSMCKHINPSLHHEVSKIVQTASECITSKQNSNTPNFLPLIYKISEQVQVLFTYFCESLSLHESFLAPRMLQRSSLYSHAVHIISTYNHAQLCQHVIRIIWNRLCVKYILSCSIHFEISAWKVFYDQYLV